MRFAPGMALLLILCEGVALAQTAPEFKPIAPDATVDQILDALKARGDSLKDFSADIKLTVVDQTTADSTADSGKFLFQKLADGDARFRVTFTERNDGSKAIGERHEYEMSDGWLKERDYSKRVETDRQVVKPGEKINLLKLGQGPFPLPVGQDKEDVKRDFDVTLIASSKDDPAGTTHLQLKPKDGTDMGRRFAMLDVYVERKSGMPVRIVTLDNAKERLQTTELTNVKLNGGASDGDFNLEKIDPSTWDVTSEPYRG